MTGEQNSIPIFLNGKPKLVGNNITIDELLSQLSVNSKHVAVEVNHEIIKRESWTTRHLNPEDRVEIVHFVGGGR